MNNYQDQSKLEKDLKDFLAQEYNSMPPIGQTGILPYCVAAFKASNALDASPITIKTFLVGIKACEVFGVDAVLAYMRGEELDRPDHQSVEGERSAGSNPDPGPNRDDNKDRPVPPG